MVLAMWHQTPHERVYLKSSAVARLLCLSGGPWPLLGRLLAAVPVPLRDWPYTFVARNRYRWFGRAATGSCPLSARDAARHLLP
jgi:predicted DCC family thiol-disulfide oxidoreductase YuxK